MGSHNYGKGILSRLGKGTFALLIGGLFALTNPVNANAVSIVMTEAKINWTTLQFSGIEIISEGSSSSSLAVVSDSGASDEDEDSKNSVVEDTSASALVSSASSNAQTNDQELFADFKGTGDSATNSDFDGFGIGSRSERFMADDARTLTISADVWLDVNLTTEDFGDAAVGFVR